MNHQVNVKGGNMTEIKLRKRLLVYLIGLALILSQSAVLSQSFVYGLSNETSAYAADTKVSDAGDVPINTSAGSGTVLAFTSDVHNGTASGGETNVGANRLQTWLDNVQSMYDNNVKVMGFCGDMGAASSNSSTFWTFTQTVMDKVADNSLTGVYAVGNHEYMNGSFDSTSNSPEVRGKYVLNGEGRNVEGENYRIYCLGTNSGHGSSWAYDDSQITALTNYLNGVSNDKVIIILTHFPLHNYGSHRTSNTAPVLSAVNTAAAGEDGIYGNADDKKIVFLWGHNHSEGDSNYDEVWMPGDKINDSNNSEVNFYYAAAGSMADKEYGSSAKVLGKGLVLEIDDQKRLSFSYYDASGNNVTEPDGETVSEVPQEPTPIEGVSISNNNPKVKVGKTLQLKYETNPKKATVESVSWSSGNEKVATVDEKTGKVTGVKEGTAEITLTVSDGLTRNVVSTSAVVTVVEAGASEEHTIDITPTSSNSPEETIEIAVGDTLVINTTNGSSNSAYDFTASLSKNNVAEFVGDTTKNIAAGASAAFTVEGVADGKVDITIKNNNSYSSSYSRKATIHLIVGDGGGSDPIPTGDSVSITPSTNNPEETIQIAVGDTLNINVTNGSSNSDYDYTASFSKDGVAEFQGDTTKNIAQGDSAVFTVKGVANGKVDITIKNNQSSSSYVRKGVIHLIVGDGGADDPIPTGDSVSITPTTDNPEESIQINAGDTLNINVTNSSERSAYDFTASLSKTGVAEIQGDTTKNIAAGASATFTVKGLTAGTVDITIQNENSYSSQYNRVGIVHLTVVEEAQGDEPVTGVTVSPKTASVSTGGTTKLTATVAPSNAKNKNVTWTSSNNSVATVSNGTVTGVTAGTATITATTVDGGFTDTCTVTVTAEKTVTFEQTNTLEAGKEYLIANGNNGSVYLLSTDAGSSKQLKGVSATVTDGKITINEATAAKTVFTSEANTHSLQNGIWLSNGGKYLYTNNSDGLRMADSSVWDEESGGGTANNLKGWHYKADGKNLLWFFSDTSSSDGYTDTSSTYKYYLTVSSGNFTDAHVSNTSLSNTSTPAMYLFEEVAAPAHEHVAGEAVRENEVAATCTEAGSYDEVTYCTVCGEKLSSVSKTIDALGHNWGEWKTVTEATETTEGLKERVCSRCEEKETEVIPVVDPSTDPSKDPTKMGTDGTAVGPGASAAAADAAITGMTADTDLPGSAFSKLTLRSPKQTKTSINLSWTKASGATSFVLYGNKCGKGNKPQKIATLNTNKLTVKKVAGANVKKGTYYKFVIVALDKDNMVVSTSKLIHVATKGGKVGNDKSVKVSKSVIKKAKSLKAGKTLKLKAKAVPQSKKLKVKKHVKVRYESTDTKIVTVSSSGKIKAKSKGTCYVYAFAQDGVYKKVKVTVK
jgi:uncharacterized protein YjdB